MSSVLVLVLTLLKPAFDSFSCAAPRSRPVTLGSVFGPTETMSVTVVPGATEAPLPGTELVTMPFGAVVDLL